MSHYSSCSSTWCWLPRHSCRLLGEASDTQPHSFIRPQARLKSFKGWYRGLMAREAWMISRCRPRLQVTIMMELHDHFTLLFTASEKGWLLLLPLL